MILLTVFENEFFSVLEGKCGVDLEFQVSIVSKVGPSGKTKNSRIGSRLGEACEKISFNVLGLKICEMSRWS